MFYRLLLSALCVLPFLAGAQAAEEDFPPLVREEGQALSAGLLVMAVLERNPGLAAMRAAVEAAEARVEPAGSLPDPMLSLSAAPNTFGSPLGSRGQVQISQALPWWGTLDAQEDAARAGAAAALQDVHSLRLHLAAATQHAYADWHYIHRALAVNRRMQDLLAELREVARVRYAAGRALQQDVLQAGVELTLLRQQALELERERTAIRARINALLNRPAAAELPPPGELAMAGPLPPQERLLAQALENHPLVRRAEFQQDAAAARVELARKRAWPQFELMAGYNSVMDPLEKRAMVGVALSIPLNRDKYDAQIDGARAERRRADYLLQDLKSELAGELAAAYAAAVEARDSLALYRGELLELARQSLDVARADYAAGRGEFLNVITAERSLLETELRLVRAEAALYQRLAELGRLAGTGYPFASAYSGAESEFEVSLND